MIRDPAIRGLADTPARTALLWDICQVPDYRKIAPANHAELVSTLFGFLARNGTIPDDWFAAQVAYADRTRVQPVEPGRARTYDPDLSIQPAQDTLEIRREVDARA